MQTKLLFEDVASSTSPLLAVFATDLNTEKDGTPQITLLTASTDVNYAASAVLSSGEFKAGLAETVLLHSPAGLKSERLLIIGVGKPKSLSTVELRKASGTAVRFAKPRGIRELSVLFPSGEAFTLDPSRSAQAILEGATLADFDPDTYKSDRKDQSISTLTLLAPSAVKTAVETGAAEGSIIAEAQNFARSLVNEPGNKLTPTVLGQRAAEMAKTSGLAAEVYSTDKLKELGMGAFLGVAQGSYEPPALIVLTYTPATSPAPDAPVFGLVGKGITFDTGGISIKPSDGMEKMKYDMAGAAAMIGAMQAIAALKPAFKVIAVICSAENMPSGRAYKPGDILTAASGKTIEINNTDAEGRLVLADGLWYARQLGATRLINAATLTGACAVALGQINAGLFTNDEAVSAGFAAAARVAGEGFWPLPCNDDYLQPMKSAIADLMNTSNTRWGGASTAAAFLSEFVGDTPWMHLDIAAMAWQDADKPWSPKGPSGFAVRSIVEWVRSTAQ